MSEEHKQRFAELATLTPVEYDQQRTKVAEELGIRVSTLDAQIDSQRPKSERPAEQPDELVTGIEPWTDSVNGDELAQRIERVIKTYCVLDRSRVTATVLWSMAAYSVDAFRIFPKLGVSSPQKRCGKTTYLETVSAFCPRSLLASNISAAVMFRVIEKWQPTLVIDEMDTFIDGNDELRGIINSGHTRKTAYVLRCDGDSHDPTKYSTWAPCILAKIGEFPDTIADRIISVELQRKLTTDNVSRLPVDLDDQLLSLRRKCQRWSDDNFIKLSVSEPESPNVSNDRAKDNWLPLLATADLIGGQWPEKARAAMSGIENATSKDDGDDLPIMLLRDIRKVITDHRWNHVVHSSRLVKELNALEERPWPSLRNDKGLSPHKIASMLKPFGLRSSSRRVPGSASTQKGYSIDQLNDVFSRYLSMDNRIQTGTTAQSHRNKGSSDSQSGTRHDTVPDSNQLKPTQNAGCAGVPFQTTVSPKGIGRSGPAPTMTIPEGWDETTVGVAQ